MIEVSKDLVEDVQFEYDLWWKQRSDNFTGKLFELIIKADPSNTYRLAQAFPVHTYVVCRAHQKPLVDYFKEVQ